MKKIIASVICGVILFAFGFFNSYSFFEKVPEAICGGFICMAVVYTFFNYMGPIKDFLFGDPEHDAFVRAQFEEASKAIEEGDIKKLEQMFEDDLDIHIKNRDDRCTLLHVAARCGNVEICEMLIDFCADVEAETCDSVTPIMLAVQYGHADVVALLEECGA